jgi:PKD repeat protein
MLENRDSMTGASMNAARFCTARHSLVALAAALSLVGCGSDLVLPGQNNPADIEVIAGDGESGLAGEAVTIVVKVTDAAGQPIEGASVNFDLTSAGDGADISPATAVTDSGGRAQAEMLLGERLGLQTGAAEVVLQNDTPPTASFSAIVLPEGQGNRPPLSDFDAHCEELSCEFSDRSSDPDGDVTVWAWTFGDGGSSDAREPAHIYPGPGTYTVTLTVTDNDGASDVSQNNVTVSAPPPIANEPPHAEFEVRCFDLVCSFEDKSTDSDGSIASWLWDFGDGSATSSAQNPVHQFDDRGKFRVTLTVTDDDGATDSKTHDAGPRDH